jgi:hypothetical protein
MPQATCGGLIKSNTGPSGHAASNDTGFSLRAERKSLGELGGRVNKVTPGEAAKWW